ncbi:MAG: CAP domain-containing protein [Desulfovibrio sp.]|jgi:uncharacterized protein YkwD|nr:CAP domain-containing protein [Desulfovibrio sp.]
MPLTKFALLFPAVLLAAALSPTGATSAGRTDMQKSQPFYEQTQGGEILVAQAGRDPGKPGKKTRQDAEKNRVLTYDAYGPTTVKPGTEPREPAPSRPIGEVETDALGRPVGPVRFYDPPGMQALPQNPAASGELGETLPQAAPFPASSAPLPPAAPLQSLPADPARSPLLQEPAPSSPEGALSGQDQPFVPPTGPGPFGVPQPPREERQGPRPGVVPLEDTRPPGSTAPLVYIAPRRSPDPGSGLESPQQPSDGSGGETGDPSSYQALPYGTEAPTGSAGGLTDPIVGAGSGTLLLDLINAERAKGRMCGGTRMPPTHALQANPILMDAALRHARDMTARRYFSSVSPEGITVGGRLTEAGYTWAFIAENLARMEGGEEAVLRGWLNAESRCVNLMGAEYFEAGIGHDPAGRNWVLTLAAPVP